MDNFSGIIADHEQSSDDALGYDQAFGDDSFGAATQPVQIVQEERRMEVRAYNQWASLLGSRDFPKIEDLTGAGAPDFAGNVVLLDFSLGTDNPEVTMLGQKLADECGAAGAIERLSDVPGDSLLSRITDRCREILVSQAPIGLDAEFVNQRNKTLLYRGILLPFSGRGETIEHVLGVINWKELAEPAASAGREFDRSAGVRQLPVILALGEWADGPATAHHLDWENEPSCQADSPAEVDGSKDRAITHLGSAAHTAPMALATQKALLKTIVHLPDWIRCDLGAKDAALQTRAEEALVAMLLDVLDPASSPKDD